MFFWINFFEKEKLTKHICCGCKDKLDGRKCNSDQKRSNDKCWCECKNPIKHRVYKEHYVCNLSTCACEINRYLKSIVDYLVITGEEIKHVSNTM